MRHKVFPAIAMVAWLGWIATGLLMSGSNTAPVPGSAEGWAYAWTFLALFVTACGATAASS